MRHTERIIGTLTLPKYSCSHAAVETVLLSCEAVARVIRVLEARAAVAEEVVPQDDNVNLGQIWFDLPEMATRGAGGRIIVAGNALTRADVDFNWDIIAYAIKVLGVRPSVDALEEHVAQFFVLSRPKGKPKVASALSKVALHNRAAC